MKVKKWMPKHLINKQNKSKCKWPRLPNLEWQQCQWARHQVQLNLHLKRQRVKKIEMTCCNSKSVIWRQRNNGSWKKRKLGSFSWFKNNKKLKKPLRLQQLLLRQLRKNNSNNRKYLQVTIIPKDVKNLRATNSILHLKEVKGRMMITLIYPSTAQVWTERSLNLQWLLLQ